MNMIRTTNSLTFAPKTQTCNSVGKFFHFRKMAITAVVFTLSTLQANAQDYIDCPLPDARRTIINKLPNGWWTTPLVNRLSGTRISKIGGKLALICEYGKSGSVQREAPTQANCQSVTGGFRCNSSAGVNSCETAVQGKIAWDYNGNKKWAKNNITRLCSGAQNSVEPARCFRDVMHGGVDWGNGTRWKWENAITLCSGSRDARNTISCFRNGIQVGKSWSEAAKFCSP